MFEPGRPTYIDWYFEPPPPEQRPQACAYRREPRQDASPREVRRWTEQPALPPRGAVLHTVPWKR